MIFTKKKKKTEQERLEDRRDRILSRGNKFRYPLQFSKKNIILATIIIGILATISMTGVLAWNLYHGQNTGDMMFRITKIFPLPVAKVKDISVKFSDYLLLYRSSLVPIEKHGGQVGKNQDAEAMKTYYKRSALSSAEDLTYATLLAQEQGISLSDEEISKEWEKQRSVGGIVRSEASFLKVLKDNFSLEKDEYLRIMTLNLLKIKVMEKIDEEARHTSAEVQNLLSTKAGDLQAVASELKDRIIYEETGGLVSNINVDGGRATVASKLEPGQISERFISNNGDGYYFVKVNEKNDKQVSYSSIKVPFREFDKQLTKIRNDGGVTEYIKL